MAFNINAQIILSQPKNLNNVTKQISKQLGKVAKIDLKIGNAQQLTNLNKQLTTLNNSFNKLNSNLKSTRGSINSLNSSFNKTSSSVGNIGKAQSNLNTQVNRTNQSLKTQAGLVGTLGKRFGSVAKQAIAFGIISRPIYDLQRALTGAVKDAVAFEKEIVRISQVTGKTVSQLDGLTQQVTKLSRELGISANELATTSRVIAQAGIRGKDLEQVLTALARSTLAPTFGKITDTTEGLIAAFGQFGLKGKDAEAVLGSLNRVSKQFAVEAEDLISVIRRTGGVFAAAAGDTKGTIGALQELTAVFTAVRSTTRESADTIAAGLRTIFSRIQRRSTISFLKQFGVDLTDAQGKFVGIFPAFDQLSQRLSTLIKQGDALTLSAIAEELGGIRQIGKLLPAIAQFDKARKALTEAQKGAVEGLGGDVAKALDTIDNRVKRIRESFNALIRQVFESDAFQGFAKSILNGSQAIIDAASSIFSSLEPILPLLTALGTVKIGRALGGLASSALGGGLAGAASTVSGSATAQNTQKTAAAVVNQNSLINTTNSTLANMSRQLANLIQINNSGFDRLNAQAARGRSTVVTGFGGARRRASGGQIYGFNRGGMVPGTGNSDTVPAMLQPGEFVIKKSSVQSLGAGTLQAMNENRFQEGGKSKLSKLRGGQEISLAPAKLGIFKKALLRRSGDKDGDAELDIGGAFLKPSGVIDNLRATIKGNEVLSEVVKDIGGTQSQVKGLLKNSGVRSKEFSIPMNIQSGSFTTRKAARFRSGFRKAAGKFGEDFNKREIGLPYSMSKFKSSYNVSNKEQIEGGIFESFLNAISNKPFDNAKINPNDTFDFKQGLGTAAKVFGLPGDLTADAKRTFDTDSLASLVKKGGNLLIQNITRDLATQLLATGAAGKQPQIAARKKAASTQKASGGAISGQDTVPALLTPGEFVFNKKAAGRIGYGNLNTMNKQGVIGFNKGGVVGFKNGGRASGGESAGAGIGLVFALQSLTAGLGESSESLSFFVNSIATAAFAVQGLGLEFGNIGKTLGNALGKIPGVRKGAGNRLAAGANNPALRPNFAGRVRAFGGVGGTAVAGAGAAAGGAVIGKIIGDIAGKAIADNLFGKQEEAAGFKGSASAEQARSRGALEGGLSGLGAGAGAGAGLGFVLGGPVGAAIGAAIGGTAGLAIGMAVGEQNAILEQAAFEAAKALQASGEKVSKSLDELEKEFTISGFGDLTKQLQEQEVNFTDAVNKFQTKFNDEITVTSAALDVSRVIPGVDSAFSAIDGLFGTTFSAASEARKNADKAFSEAAKLIDPEDVKRARKQLNNSLDKFIEDFDFDELSQLSGTDLVDSLTRAADAGNTFAENILKAAEAIAIDNLRVRAEELKQGDVLDQTIGRTVELALRERRPGDSLEQIAARINSGTAARALPQRFMEFDPMFSTRVQAASNAAALLFKEQQSLINKQGEEAVQRGIVNTALKDTGEELKNIIKSLTNPFTDLEFQVQQASDSFDTFKANVDRVFAGQGGFQTRGIQAGAFGSGSLQATAERQRLFRALDAIAPGGSAGARASQRLRDQGPEIVKEVLKSARDTASSRDETLTPTVLLTRLETAFRGAGFELPQGISDVLSGIGREDGSAIPEDILADLIKSDTLTQQFGEVFDAAAEGPEKFAESLNKAIAASEKRISLEVELLNKQRELTKSITELRIATEQRSKQILSGTSFGAPTGTEIPDAIDRLNRRVVAIAGTSDSGALLGRRGAALQRQAQLQQQIDANPALALRKDIQQERKALADEINQTTEALNVLATETEVFASIIEKANQIGQNIGALESGLSDVINKVVSGDIAGVQQLAIDQFTIGRAISGIATLPQALNALNALGQEQNKALVDVVTGIEGSGDVLRRNLLRQAGERLRAGGGLSGRVAGSYLLGILQQEEKALALDELQKERAKTQEGIQRDIQRQNIQQVELLRSINNQLAGDAFAIAVKNFNSAVDKFVNAQAPTPAPPAPIFAKGGSIFKPRGTDTVPAMLTPGEFVIRKSAVDQYGTGMMEAINSGNAQVFAAAGGRIGKGVLYRKLGGFADLDGGTGRSKRQVEDYSPHEIPDGRVYSMYGVFRDRLPFGSEGSIHGTGILDPVTGEEIFNYKKGKGKDKDGKEVNVYYPVNQKFLDSLASKRDKDGKILEMGEKTRQVEDRRIVVDQALELVRQGKAESIEDVIGREGGAKREAAYRARTRARLRTTATMQAIGDSASALGSFASGLFGGTQDAKPKPTGGGGRPAPLDRAATGLDPVPTGGGGGRPAPLDRAATGLDPVPTGGGAGLDPATAQTFPDGIPAPGSRSSTAAAPVQNVARQVAQQVATEVPDQFREGVDRYFKETQFVFNNLIQRGLKPSIRRRTDDIRNASFIQARKYLLDRLEVDVFDGGFSLSGGGQQISPEQASLARKLLKDRVAEVKKQVSQSTRQLGLGINLLSFGGGFDPMQNRQFAGTGGMRADGTSPDAKVFDLKPKFRSEGGEIPAVLQSGEFVMNRQAVQRNGIGMLSRMNQGLPTFHSGGYVSGAAQYRQAGGRIFGRDSNGPQSAVTVNGSDAAKELNNAIITGGETVKQSWQTLFDTVTEGLNSALGQISTIPNQINTTIAPIQIEGVTSFTDALTAQLVPKIIQQIAPLINANGDGNNSANQGDGLNSRNG